MKLLTKDQALAAIKRERVQRIAVRIAWAAKRG